MVHLPTCGKRSPMHLRWWRRRRKRQRSRPPNSAVSSSVLLSSRVGVGVVESKRNGDVLFPYGTHLAAAELLAHPFDDRSGSGELRAALRMRLPLHLLLLLGGRIAVTKASGLTGDLLAAVTAAAAAEEEAADANAAAETAAYPAEAGDTENCVRPFWKAALQQALPSIQQPCAPLARWRQRRGGSILVPRGCTRSRRERGWHWWRLWRLWRRWRLVHAFATRAQPPRDAVARGAIREQSRIATHATRAAARKVAVGWRGTEHASAQVGVLVRAPPSKGLVERVHVLAATGWAAQMVALGNGYVAAKWEDSRRSSADG